MVDFDCWRLDQRDSQKGRPLMLETKARIERAMYTADQIKAAKEGVMIAESWPCNPMGVSHSLNAAYKAEFAATGSTYEALQSPAAQLILNELCNMSLLIPPLEVTAKADLVQRCRERIAHAEKYGTVGPQF